MGEELSIYIVSLKCFGDLSGENDVQLASSNSKHYFKQIYWQEIATFLFRCPQCKEVHQAYCLG